MSPWTAGPGLLMVSALICRKDLPSEAAPTRSLDPSLIFNGGFMMDARRNIKNALDAHGRLQIRIQPSKEDNISWVGVIEDAGRSSDDDIGALYYVVAVIFIYGLSIVMMIASHIRKNKQDSQLRTYLKEMAKLRKSDRREKVLSKMNDLANRHKNQEAAEAKQKTDVKLKDGDNEVEKEECRLLDKKDEDNTDSVFLPAEFCISPLPSLKKYDCPIDVASIRNISVSSKGSGRNNSVSSCINFNVPSASQSPSLSESRYDSSSDRLEPRRLRSPSFHHDYRRWRRGENRVVSGQDYRTVRIHGRLSPSANEKRSVTSPTNSFNEFRLSVQPGLEKSSTTSDARSNRCNSTNSLRPNSSKLLRNADVKQALKILEVKQSMPASFHVVDEDAVL